MTDLAALIPPFLMAAVVIAAIVAFLRHEMGKVRPDRRGRGDDNSGPAHAAAEKLDDGASADQDAPASARRDG